MENSPQTNSPPPECSHPYLSLNPSLFDSAEHWSYRDLQRLAKRLDLPAGGKRDEIVARLQAWHRGQRRGDQAGKFLGVEIRAAPGAHAVSPRLLAPLSAPSPSPGSILSSAKKAERLIGRSPLRPASGVAFSPFNQVKLIPSKEYTEMYGQYREPSWDVLDDDDDGEMMDVA